MAAYGVAPSVGEIEVTVIGPGFGESILAHIGNGKWIIVDSCIEPTSKSPAALHYLEEIGVSPDNVVAIVASHWHDDHVKGLTQVVETCKNARLFISQVFSNKEAIAFAKAQAGGDVLGLTRGTRELYGSIKATSNKSFADQGTCVWQDRDEAGNVVRVVAFSPTPATMVDNMHRILSYLPDAGSSAMHVPVEFPPNIEAIVLCLDLGDESVLLGSDLEDHGPYGWEHIINDHVCTQQPKASVYKVAHHGSVTAEHAGIWSTLVVDKPISVLTPFNLGRHSLPNPTDVARMKANSSEVYISSNRSRRHQLPRALHGNMSNIATDIRPRNSGFGIVRSRKTRGQVSWSVELFGDAVQL